GGAQPVVGEVAATTHRHHGNARLGRGGGDPRGGFAVQGLLVQRPFAGDDQAGAVQVGGEVQQGEQVVDAGAQLGAEEGDRGEPHSPGGTRTRPAGHVHLTGPAVVLGGPGETGGAGGDGGQPGQARFQDRDLVGGRALLRAVDGGGAVRAEKGVVHVTGDDELDA